MNRSMLIYDGPSGLSVGLMVHALPGSPSFERAVHVAQTALKDDCKVFLYLLDEAVEGATDPAIHSLLQKGVKVSACGFAMEKRQLECPEEICPAGLTTLSDILFHADMVSVYN